LEEWITGGGRVNIGGGRVKSEMAGGGGWGGGSDMRALVGWGIGEAGWGVVLIDIRDIRDGGLVGVCCCCWKLGMRD